MKTYIVTGTHGEYSDRSDWNVCVVHSEERAKEIINKLGVLCVYNEQFGGRVRTEFDLLYDVEHPKPSLFPMAARPRPSAEHAALIAACTGGNGTPEFRQRLKEHEAIQQKIKEEWNSKAKDRDELHNSWYWAKKDAEEQWIKENYNPPEHLKEMMPYCGANHYSDSHYDYEECPVLDV